MTGPAPGNTQVAVFPDDRFALARLHGSAEGTDLLRVGHEIVSHPEWRPGFTEVWDVRAASVSVSPAELRALGSAEEDWKDLLAGSLTLVIVDRDLVRYALQLYAKMVEPLGRRLQVCRTEREAAGILGIERLPDLPEAG